MAHSCTTIHLFIIVSICDYVYVEFNYVDAVDFKTAQIIRVIWMKYCTRYFVSCLFFGWWNILVLDRFSAAANNVHTIIIIVFKVLNIKHLNWNVFALSFIFYYTVDVFLDKSHDKYWLFCRLRLLCLNVLKTSLLLFFHEQPLPHC